MEAQRIIFKGRVQGVGFRYTTNGIAKNFEVVGYVKNLADGSVEVFVESADFLAIENFIVEIEKTMVKNIDGIEREAVAPKGYKDFSIQR